MWKALNIGKCAVYSSKQTLGADEASATGFTSREGAHSLVTIQARSDPKVAASCLSEMVDQLADQLADQLRTSWHTGIMAYGVLSMQAQLKPNVLVDDRRRATPLVYEDDHARCP